MPIPKFLQPKTKQKIGRDGEKKTIKQLSRPASGALWFSKGDISIDDMLGEVKTTEKTQFILKEKILEKIFLEATGEGKVPYVIINFKGFSLVGQVIRR
jgi:hypothetical protein